MSSTSDCTHNAAKAHASAHAGESQGQARPVRTHSREYNVARDLKLRTGAQTIARTLQSLDGSERVVVQFRSEDATGAALAQHVGRAEVVGGRGQCRVLHLASRRRPPRLPLGPRRRREPRTQ